MRTRFINPCIDILKSPRGLWYIIGAFVVDSMAYFGILTLMVTYFSKGLEWPDKCVISYFVIFSIGEALWSARFLEYASELAPAGRVAQYMGLANVPWLLAKGTTGLYSGYLLATFCPKHSPPAQMHTGTLWLIYACIAMTSPIGLWLGRNWVHRGLRHAERPAG